MQHAAQEVLRPHMLRLVEHGLRRPLLDDDTAIDEQHPISHIPGKSHFVRDHDHSHAIVGKFAHDAEHVTDEFGVERGGRLVEQDRLGLHRQRTRDCDPLLRDHVSIGTQHARAGCEASGHAFQCVAEYPCDVVDMAALDDQRRRHREDVAGVTKNEAAVEAVHHDVVAPAACRILS